ncbi:type IV secretory system conjugative DNA transfer family protein [Lacticaseibacillus paracasei]|nr:type IV secretory system conjugative DNA transfer family protein [Lacticaseibacillus paracasei]MCB5816215.1 type IV secretory system conjugative DNA transfer family protein [Lacticaseibacillus paracasei]RND98610.1 Conjugal transfer protein TraG [Lacticaseibacillus paracasei]RNE15983.1 Conjugal transfer protein TraG [Lacticaseibacillus paracasei]
MNHEKRQWREALGNKRFLIAIAGLWLIGGLLILNWLTHIPSMFLKLMKQAPSLQTIVATVLHPANFLWPDFTYLLVVLLYLVGLVALVIYVLIRTYRWRKAFQSINTGQKGTGRFARVAEVAAASIAIPLNDYPYVGKSGVPQLHIKKDQMDKYELKTVVQQYRGADQHHGVDLVDTSGTNTVAVAGPGGGKTTLFSLPVLDFIMRASVHDSVIITDVKGEMLRSTKAEFEARGYRVAALNLVDPTYSIAYNPLELVKQAYAAGDFDNAQMLCNTFSYSIFHNPNAKEPMWEQSSISLLNALILEVCKVCFDQHTPEKITMYTVTTMLSELGANPDENGMTKLDKFFSKLPSGDPAKLQYGTIQFSQGITRSGIFTGTMAGIKNYAFSNIGRLTATNDFNIADLATGDKPVAFFIIYPDYDNSNYSLVATFLSQVGYVLAKMATLAADSKLKRRVINLYEELGNLPRIEGLPHYLNVGRGRGLVYYLILQSIAQLEANYGKEGAAEIMGACGNKYDILADNYDDAEYFSKQIGQTTVIAPSRHGAPMDTDKSFGESQETRRLMMPDELLRLRKGEVVLIRSKQRSDLENRSITAWPIHANPDEGTELPFSFEYLMRFNHQATFAELYGDKKPAHNDIDLKKLLLDITVTTIKPQNENDDPEITVKVNGHSLNAENDEPQVEQNVSEQATTDENTEQETEETSAVGSQKPTHDSKPNQGSDQQTQQVKEPQDPQKQITTEIDQQATPLSTLFSKSQLQMIEKGVQELLTQDDYAEYQSLDSVEAMTHWLNARRAMKSFAAQLDFAYQKLDAFKKKEGDNA